MTESFDNLKKVKLSNGEVYGYREYQRGGLNTILFLHATMSSSQMLNTGFLLQKLSAALPNYNFIAPDMRGNGYSTYNNRISKLEDLSEDIRLFLDALNLKKVILIGTCLGGYVSGIFSARYPQYVENLILIGAVTFLGGGHMFKGECKNYEDIINTPHYKYTFPLMTGEFDEQLKQSCDGFHPTNWVKSHNFEKLFTEIKMSKNLKEVFWGEIISNYSNRNNGYYNGSGEIKNLKTRTMIIHGTNDTTIPISHAEEMSKAIEGCRYVPLEGKQHFTWYDDCDLTVKHIKVFLLEKNFDEPKKENFDDLKKISLSNGEEYTYREQSAFDQRGSQKTILFLHATMSSSQMLNTGFLLQKLSAALPNYNFIAPDMRGNGSSTYKNRISKLEDLSEDIRLFLDALNLKKVILIGTCLGGYVSGIFSARYPQYVENLILIGAVTFLGGGHMFKGECKNYEDIINTPHYKYTFPLMTGEFDEQLKQSCDGFHPTNWVKSHNFEKLFTDIKMSKNLKEVFWGEIISNYSNRNNGYYNGSGEIKNLKTRTMIIHGTNDTTIPISHAEEMSKAIEGCRYVPLEGKQHFTWYDDCDLTVKHIKVFLLEKHFDDLQHIKLSNGEVYAYREQSAFDQRLPSKTILFLHATKCSSQMLNTGFLLKKLSAALPNYNFIAPDLRGQGQSSYNNKIQVLEDFAEDLKLFLEAVNLPKITLLATCLGGYVSGVFTCRYPQMVENLILIGAVTMLGAGHCFKGEAKTYDQIVETPHYKYFVPLLNAGKDDQIKKLMEGFHPDTWTTSHNIEKLMYDINNTRNLKEVYWGEVIANYSSVNNGYVDGSGEIKNLKARSLIIHGTGDKIIPISHAKQMADAIVGCKFVPLVGIRHYCWYDNCDQIVDLVQEFINQ